MSISSPQAEPLIGQRIKRSEDPRLLTGHGSYVDDIQLDNMLHLDILRSPYAHATIKAIDASAALTLPGVQAVYTGRELAAFLPPVPSGGGMEGFNAPEHHTLAIDRVRFVGEGVVAVLASDRYIARDARELIRVDYQPLAAVADPDKALQEDAPVLHDFIGNNVGYRMSLGNETDAALERSELLIRQRLVNQRVIPNAMETRGVVAQYRHWEQQLTVWLSTQAPHLMRREFSRFLDFPEHRLRVIAPDVGGAFGAKNNAYPEELLAAALALKLGCAVKWIEERQEHMLVTSHARAQTVDLTAGVDRDGRINALHFKLTADMGAYYHAITPVGPMMTAMLMTGAYRIPHAKADIVSVFTNTTPTDPYRGFGRAEAAYFIERTMDLIARELALDPVQLRRRNFIQPEQFPFATPSGHVHESGAYELCLQRALAKLDYAKMRREQQLLREQGRYLGIGIATHVWRAGFPSVPGGRGYVVGGWEKAIVSVDPGGKVRVVIGTSPHGQGIVTTTAQIVADTLGVPLTDIAVLHSDTDKVAQGNGTMGSRSLVVGGSAVLQAAQKVRDQALRLAAHMLRLEPARLTLVAGRFRCIDDPAINISFADVANRSFAGPVDLPPGMASCLEAAVIFEASNFVSCFGTHICVAEVEADTARVKLLRYIAVDDAGRLINPDIVEGQLHGGIVQGIGQALMEEAVYDEMAQPLSSSFLDYAIPRAIDLPLIEVEITETPSTVNPLGARGIGEAGTVGAPPAVVNAVVDALAPFGVKHLDMPLTPNKLWRAMQQGKS
ncbi:MAG: xanthine dehydrogenase family protein molybdopterin-binding subunit [Pseudomonadales bacterium]|nr:xanthine dehydrogenase family protein molybdopterin-binding subunit [Pseudomonadales bacterium]